MYFYQMLTVIIVTNHTPCCHEQKLSIDYNITKSLLIFPITVLRSNLDEISAYEKRVRLKYTLALTPE